MGGAQSSEKNFGGATTNGAIDDRAECPEGQYVGDWFDHKWHGHGTLTWHSGTTYTGEWRAGKRNGHGKMVWKSGAVYEGGFKDNKRFGNGTYTYTNGNKYEGGFRDDCLHGHGRYTFHQGHVYEGAYNMGQQCGRGKIVYHSGTIFDGQFKDSRIQYGLLIIATHEYVASFEEADEADQDPQNDKVEPKRVDPITVVYNVQLSSHDGKFFKPLQFCEGNFLETEAVMKKNYQEETKQPGAEIKFVPRAPVEEELIKRKNLHERPPALSPEPAKHRYENEDMEDEP
mmetsp:Transcript_19958/g.33637  ORF Transcript_19958/g.33637 Transcript_19958/m.33637 type:complete len:286 (-) Transcript_19958:157-1014(-)